MSSNTTPVDASILDKMEYEILIQAINGISDVRQHDNNILVAAQESNELACWAIFMSIFVTIVTIFASIYIYRRQENIIREQLRVSEQQNKIALFEKSYEIICAINSFTVNINSLKKGLENIHKKSDFMLKKELISSLFCYNNSNPLEYTQLNNEDFLFYIYRDTNNLKKYLHKSKLIFKLDDDDKSELEFLEKMIDFFTNFLFYDNTVVEIKLINDKLNEHVTLYPDSRLLKNLEKQLYLVDIHNSA